MRLCRLQPTCAVHKSENISWSENLDLQLWWLFLNMFREVQVGTWKHNQNPGADKPSVCAQWKRSEFNFILFEKGGRFSWQAHKICVMVRVADTQSQGENHLHSVIILSGSSFKLSWASVPVPKLSLRRKKNYIQHLRCPLESSWIFIAFLPLFIKPLVYLFVPHVKVRWGTSLVVQWLRCHAPHAGGPDLIPGQGTRSHMPQLNILHAAIKTQYSQLNEY